MEYEDKDRSRGIRRAQKAKVKARCHKKANERMARLEKWLDSGHFPNYEKLFKEALRHSLRNEGKAHHRYWFRDDWREDGILEKKKAEREWAEREKREAFDNMLLFLSELNNCESE